MDQSFRFLDLPIELRLMIYERLPTKVTHCARTSDPESFKYVRETLPGIVILASCRQVKTEASIILGRRLVFIQNKPIRIIVTIPEMASFPLIDLLRCLSWPKEDPVDTDIKSLLRIIRRQHSKTRDGLSSPAPGLQRIQIALRDDLEYDIILMGVIHMMFVTLQYDFASMFRTRELNTCFPDIVVRPALLSPKEKALFMAERPLAWCPTSLQMGQTVMGGDEIKAVEWDADWAEGEFYF
jgi:hypothetical protein